jgi:hypothetical protein
METLYYECHVTIDPVLDSDRHELLTKICADKQFRVAKLLMSKGNTFTPSENDSFMTGRSKSYADLLSRMVNLCYSLQKNSFVIRRYKIETAILDSKDQGDILQLID